MDDGIVVLVHSFYVLRCADGSLYIGETAALDVRLGSTTRDVVPHSHAYDVLLLWCIPLYGNKPGFVRLSGVKLPPPHNDMNPPQRAFIIIGGRRWRTSDPSVPDNLRQELVNELMAARRAVRDGKNQSEIRRSRRRVNDAKVALGERGHAWWLPPSPTATNRRIEAAVRALLWSRRPCRS